MINLNVSQSTTLESRQGKIGLRKSIGNGGDYPLVKKYIRDLTKWKGIIEGWEKESTLLRKLVRLATTGREQAPALDYCANQLTSLLQNEIENFKTQILALEWQNRQPDRDKTVSRREIQQRNQQMTFIAKSYIDLRDKVLEELAHSFPFSII